MTFLLGKPIFRCELLVSRREEMLDYESWRILLMDDGYGCYGCLDGLKREGMEHGWTKKKGHQAEVPKKCQVFFFNIMTMSASWDFKIYSTIDMDWCFCWRSRLFWRFPVVICLLSKTRHVVNFDFPLNSIASIPGAEDLHWTMMML